MADEKTIKLTPETTEAINDLLSETSMNLMIIHLQDAEEELEKVASRDLNDDKLYCFRYAYDLRQIRMRIEKALELFGYERE